MHDTDTQDTPKTTVRLTSVALLFIVVVALAVGLIGVNKGETSPWVLTVPIAVGTYATLTIREKR